MKAGPECKECLRLLMRQVMELSTSDPKVRSGIRKEISRILEGFSAEIIPPDLSNEFHRAARALSKNPDPFRERKLEELERARKVFSKIEHKGDLRSCVEIAAQGNAIDFFVDPKILDRELSVKPNFAIDDIPRLERKLGSAKDILYLADNAGEVFFDIPLLKFLEKKSRTWYVVKEAPVQNDLSINDIRRASIDIPVRILTAPGVVGFYPGLASPELRKKFERADLVVAKGMGHYETLTELSESKRFFFIVRAKCAPVARSLGVSVGDYVAMLR